MRTIVEIQNLKCGGCANTITNGLKNHEDVRDLVVDVANNKLSFSFSNETTFNEFRKFLSKWGYPLKDEKNTLGKKAKSYVSCAIGKLGNQNG